MKVSELRRMLEKNGWYIHRNGANHDMYRHSERPTEPSIPVSRHMTEELKKGTEISILKKAGLK